MINIDESYKVIDEKYRGRKSKLGLIKDNKKYIFKYDSINNEILAELISEQLGIQCGIEMAHYNCAKMGDYYGVITPNFIEKNEYIIHADTLKNNVQMIFFENNKKFDLTENSIENIMTAISFMYPNIDLITIMNELLRRWCFYLLIYETDKNDTNISLLLHDNGQIKLSPDYDNSSMCQLSKNINSVIDNIRYCSNIHFYTREIKSKFILTDCVKRDFISQFNKACELFPEQIQIILDVFNKIDIDKAISNVENDNNLKIPYSISFVINKFISTRLIEMNELLNNNLILSNQKHRLK